MKLSSSRVAAALLIFGMMGSAQAQNYVLESQVVLTGTVLTQGPDASVTTVQGGTTITTNRVINTSFTNREVIAAMLARSLMAGPSSGWGLVSLADASGRGGIYAEKSGAQPVAVPADLLTLPIFGPAVYGGMTVTAPVGGDFSRTSSIAFATVTVDGIAASGLANNTQATSSFTMEGRAQDVNTVTTTMNFAGGTTGTGGSRLVKGVITIGSAKLSALTALP